MPPISQASTLLNENRTVFVERTIFNTLLFLGGFLNATILVVAFWSRHVHRRTGWYNVLVSWVIYSISYLLIFGYQNGPEPSFGVCIAQAALIYSCPVLCALSLACLLVDYYNYASALTFRREETNPWTSKLLLLFPWVAFVLMGYVALMSIVNPSVVLRKPGNFYCSMKTDVPALVSAIVIFIASVVALVVEAHMAVILYRHWGAFQRSSLDKPYLSLSMFLRLSLLNILILVADGLDVSAMKDLDNKSSTGWIIAMAILPILVALTFGTQRDILSAYMFWRE